MRIFLIKLLLRLLSDNSSKQMKDEVVQEWLMSLSEEKSGYKGYYTIRKRAIQGVLSVGLEPKEYWMNLGRLAELKQMNSLSMDLIKKSANSRKAKEKKQTYEKDDVKV
jgi:hypothetical protein